MACGANPGREVEAMPSSMVENAQPSIAPQPARAIQAPSGAGASALPSSTICIGMGCVTPPRLHSCGTRNAAPAPDSRAGSGEE